MRYQKRGEYIYLPEVDGIPLKNVEDVKFKYYLSSRKNGEKVDVDITTKLFDQNRMYVRKASYKLGIGEIEDCVKENLIDHMRSLGMDAHNIPEALINDDITNHVVKSSSSTYKD